MHHYIIMIVQLSPALDVISSHHHMVYHLLNTNIQQNIGIVKEYCVVPPYHEQQIMSAPTAKESNKRLLKFIEDRYSFTCEYDEFFVILRKLIEMPQALQIIDKYQKSTYVLQYVHTYSLVYVCTYQCIYVCMYVCMYVCTVLLKCNIAKGSATSQNPVRDFEIPKFLARFQISHISF